MLLVALLSVKEEWYATFLYREYGKPKSEESKLFHRWGFFLIVVVGISFAGLPLLHAYLTNTTTYYNFWNFVNTAFLNAWIYWLIFDTGYALLLTKGKDPYYLGDEASLDANLKRLFGNNIGKKKAIALVVLIVLQNVLQITLLK